MELRLAVTPSPVLVGPPPGVTVTVKSVALPAATVHGLAAPTPVGFVGVFTVIEMVVLPVRDKGAVSVMVTGRLFPPGAAPFETVALKEKMLSAASASPFKPSS